MSQSCCGVGAVWRFLLPPARSLAQSVSGSLAQPLRNFRWVRVPLAQVVSPIGGSGAGGEIVVRW